MFEPPIKRVSATVLRQLFNESGYWEQYKNGQLQSILRKSKHPSAPLANEPICTQSQYITYVNEAGRPDPKEVLIDGVLYIIETPEINSSKSVSER